MTPVLNASQMQAADRATAELGIPSVILMENAGQRVTDFLAMRFAPLSRQHIAVFCGKGNNGGDGLVAARQIYTRFSPASLSVVLLSDDLSGDAAANLRMLQAAGCPTTREAPAYATLIVDALLGTGLTRAAEGPALEAIRRINTAYPAAQVVSIDLPSGIQSDTATLTGEHVRADATVTFTAPKPAQVLGPACYQMGELTVASIGTPAHLLSSDLSLIESASIRSLFVPRQRNSNKGMYGHVLTVAGSPGRTGAAALCGLSALRAGAGLVTIASSPAALPLIAGYSPELMTEELTGDILALAKKMTVLAVGPGLGTKPETASLVHRLFNESTLPAVFDADALNALAGKDFTGPGHLRVLTPHPGEMSRLSRISVAEVQANRLEISRKFARERQVILVLKGDRTLIAFPDGRVWVNPTGSPSMATGGTGDVLTGLIAGMLAQHPQEAELAVAAGVYLHGLSGEIGARHLTEQCFTATDLLRYLPDAIQQVQNAV